MNRITPNNRNARRILSIACATALAAAFTASLPAHAEKITLPAVPFNIEVPAGNHAYLVGHAYGTQNYVCLPVGGSFKFVLFTPEATLFNQDGKELITHYFSPNPFDQDPTPPGQIAEGPIRATWQDSRDTSTVWAKVRPADPTIPGDLGDASTDPRFVSKGAVAWLKLTVTGTEAGPTGGDTLTKTTFIQRLNTSGGLAPTEACISSADVGKQAFVPYTADYFFFTDQ